MGFKTLAFRASLCHSPFTGSRKLSSLDNMCLLGVQLIAVVVEMNGRKIARSTNIGMEEERGRQ